MEIGKNIAKYRRAKGWTQEELGQRLGVTNQAVSKWESQTSMPDISLLPSLTRALGISFEALYGMDEPTPERIPPDEFPERAYDALHEAFRRLWNPAWYGSWKKRNIDLYQNWKKAGDSPAYPTPAAQSRRRARLPTSTGRTKKRAARRFSQATAVPRL